MTFCPKCQKEYSKNYSFCPLDGTVLQNSNRAADQLARDTLLKENYRILHRIRANEIETLYLGQHELSKKRLLVKVFNDQFISKLSSLESFKTSLAQASRLIHKYIAVTYDFDQLPDGKFFIVTDLIDGVSLEDVIKKEAPLEQRHVVYLARQIAEALKESHRHGIAHGNLSPSDIVITHDLNGSPMVKIFGLGSAKFIAEYKLRLIETGNETGVSIREVAYVSPEFAGGGRYSGLDERDDLYSVGIVMYEMLFGGLPFEAHSAQAMIYAHVTIDPIAIKNLRPDLKIALNLDALIMKAIAKQRDKRFSSFEELIVSLDEVYEEFRLRTASVASTRFETPLPEPKFRTEAPVEEALEPAQNHYYKKLILAGVSLLAFFVVAISMGILYVYYKPQYGRLNVKTNPSGAQISIDGKVEGASPLFKGRLSAGKHTVKALKDGYVEQVRELELKPNTQETLTLTLESLSSSRLLPEQRRLIAELTHKAESAFKEGILAPPPDDYNVVYFCNKILEIDAVNMFALETKNKVAEKYRTSGESAMAAGNWLDAEKQYKILWQILPNDEAIKQKLIEITSKIEDLQKEKQKKIDELINKVELAIQNGNLVPPAPDNALDNINAVQRLDSKNAYARRTKDKVREQLRRDAEDKIADAKWEEAKADYLALLRYFPSEKSASAKLAFINSEIDKSKQASDQKAQQDQQQKSVAELQDVQRQGALAYKAGDYDKAITLLNDVQKRNGADAETYFYLASAYQKRELFDNAITYFQKCITLNPSNAAAHLNLGILYDSYKKNFPEAERYLVKSQELGGTENYSPGRISDMIEKVKLKIRLVERETKPFAVEHKHVFGSCRGSMAISSWGVRFDAVETDHSFSENWENVRVLIKDHTFEFRTRGDKKFNIRSVTDEDNSFIKLLIEKYKRL